jgi:hypothetical protein
MKQTFVQYFRSSDIYKPLTREQIAKALIKMAEQLRLPGQPDPDQSYWPIEPHHSFEIEGHGEQDKGRIKLTVNL